MGKNKPGKGKKEHAVFKVAGVRKAKTKTVNSNLKKVTEKVASAYILPNSSTRMSYRIPTICPSIFQRPLPSLPRWPLHPLIGWDIFYFSSETAEQNLTILDRK